MLASYQAKISGNHIEWLETPPSLNEAEVIVTILSKSGQQAIATNLHEIDDKKIDNPNSHTKNDINNHAKRAKNTENSRAENIAILHQKINIPNAIKGGLTVKEDIMDIPELTAVWETST